MTTGRLDGTLGAKPITVRASGQTITVDAPMSGSVLRQFWRMRQTLPRPSGKLGLNLILRVGGVRIRQLQF